MPRILFVAERFPPEIGGLARSGQRIAETLADLGHDVDVFTSTDQLDAGRAQSEPQSERLTIHRFGKSKTVDFSLQQATIFLEWLHTSGAAGRPFDLVWSHYALHNGFLGIWFAKQFAIKSVLAVRGNDVDRQIFPPGDLSRLQWSLENATRVIAVSKDLASKIRNLSDITPQVVYNSVDSDVFRPGSKDENLKQKFDLRPDELVLVFSGELRAKKGLPMLIECLRRLSHRRPARLLIIGDIRAKDQGRFVRETAEVENAHRAIVRTGYLHEPDEIAAHLRLGDMFVLPSLWDGLPNSLLEAMSVGIPVIASDAGAMGEVITDREHGILIPRAQLHQMADEIENFLAKPGTERNAMITAARDHVRQHHSPEEEREQLRALIESLCSII